MISKRYWLNGGIVGLIFYVSLSLLLIPSGGIEGFCSIFCFQNWFLPTFLGGGIFALYLPTNFQFGGIMFFIFAVITYFFIGATLGFIYGKIKNRNILIN